MSNHVFNNNLFDSNVMYNVPFFNRVLEGRNNSSKKTRVLDMSLNSHLGNDRFEIRFVYKTVAGTVIPGNGNIIVTRNDTDQTGDSIQAVLYYDGVSKFNNALTSTGINGVDFIISNITPTQISVINDFDIPIEVWAWFTILNYPSGKPR
jgi:hypothetical protein